MNYEYTLDGFKVINTLPQCNVCQLKTVSHSNGKICGSCSKEKQICIECLESFTYLNPLASTSTSSCSRCRYSFYDQLSIKLKSSNI